MFAAEGAKVVVAEFDASSGEETVGLVTDAGGEATFVQADVSVEDDARRMVEAAASAYGRVDVLYNNAGVMPEADHSVIDTDVETWDKVMAVNLRGVFLGCKHAIPRMLEQGSGSIINISSFVALLGCSVPQDAYTASKGAVLSLTRSLAVQFGPQGVRIERHLPGPDRDAAADGLAPQGRGCQAAPPRPQPDRALREAGGDRQPGRLPRQRRVALDERGGDGRGRRHQRELLLKLRFRWSAPRMGA